MLVIKSAISTDCEKLADTIRPDDEAECLALGTHPIAAIGYAFHKSYENRTAFWDGEVAAMWGVFGSLFGELGQPWFLTGKAFDNIPVKTIVRVYREEVAKMLRHFPVLTNIVDARYDKAVKLLQLAGFTLDGPYPIGRNNEEFYVFKKVGDSRWA